MMSEYCVSCFHVVLTLDLKCPTNGCACGKHKAPERTFYRCVKCDDEWTPKVQLGRDWYCEPCGLKHRKERAGIFPPEAGSALAILQEDLDFHIALGKQLGVLSTLLDARLEKLVELKRYYENR